jgi:hypothetical protein
VHDRQSKDAADGISRNRVDRALMRLDRACDLAEGTAQHAPQQLRVEVVSVLRRDRYAYVNCRYGLALGAWLPLRRGRGRGRGGLQVRLRLLLLTCSVGVERDVLTEDGLVQIAEGAAWLDPELVHQRSARGLEGLECLRLPARPVEGEHQLRAESLT